MTQTPDDLSDPTILERLETVMRRLDAIVALLEQDRAEVQRYYAHLREGTTDALRKEEE